MKKTKHPPTGGKFLNTFKTKRIRLANRNDTLVRKQQEEIRKNEKASLP